MQKTEKTKHIVFVRPKLYPKQHEAIFSPKRYAITIASTKAGKTFGCLVYILEKALGGRPRTNYWWIAPSHSQAQMAFLRLKRYMQPLILQGIAKANDTEKTISIAGDRTIQFKSGEKPDLLYGEDVHAVVIDEASRVREDAWHAIRSTITATKGQVRIIGNVKGRRNWFWRMYAQAEGKHSWSRHKLTAWDAVEAGVLDREEIEDAQRMLPEHVFRELYLAEPSDDGGNPFGLEAIRNVVVDGLSSNPPVCYGVDLAKYQDWTVIIGLDRDGRVAEFRRFRHPWMETMEIIRTTCYGAPTLVDATGVGDPIVEQLQRHGMDVEPFVFTSTSKQQLMERLAVAIQRREIRVPEGPIVQELESFEYEYSRSGVRYSAPEGEHDDCVCALALALRALDTRAVRASSLEAVVM